jgi:hypothetical protein
LCEKLLSILLTMPTLFHYISETGGFREIRKTVKFTDNKLLGGRRKGRKWRKRSRCAGKVGGGWNGRLLSSQTTNC